MRAMFSSLVILSSEVLGRGWTGSFCQCCCEDRSALLLHHFAAERYLLLDFTKFYAFPQSIASAHRADDTDQLLTRETS